MVALNTALLAFVLTCFGVASAAEERMSVLETAQCMADYLNDVRPPGISDAEAYYGGSRARAILRYRLADETGRTRRIRVAITHVAARDGDGYGYNWADAIGLDLSARQALNDSCNAGAYAITQ